MDGVRAISFDFFQTLAYHRTGDGGRGRALMAYLQTEGMSPRPWEHMFLYDILEPHAREYSPDHAPAQKRDYYERVARRVFERLDVAFDDRAPPRHAAKIWELIGPASLAIYPDVERALVRLRAAGYRLVVVSNWQCGLGHFCTELGLGGYFEHVLASAEVGHAKPAREIFDEAVKRLGVAHDDVLHVGDTRIDDLDGARAAGLCAVLLDRLGDHRDDPRADAGIAQADPVARDLDGVLDLLGIR